MIATAWGQTLSEDGTGLYNDLLSLLTDRLSAPPAIRIIPYERAIQRFPGYEAACIYPFGRSDFLQAKPDIGDAALIESRPVFMAPSFVFSPPEQPAIRSWDELRDRKLIQQLGEWYDHLLPNLGVEFFNVPDESAKVKAILAGRADGMFGTVPDILIVFRTAGIKPLPFDPAFPVSHYAIGFTCADSPDTRAFVSDINERADALRADGSIELFFRLRGIHGPALENLVRGGTAAR